MDPSTVEQDLEAALAVIGDPALRAQRGERGTTLAHTAVRYHQEAALTALEVPEVRELATDRGWTVAHEAALNHEPAARRAMEDEAIYRLANDRGYTVAHLAAEYHAEIARRAVLDPEVRTIRDLDQGRTVAHSATTAQISAAREALEIPEVCELEAADGMRVAWVIAARHEELAEHIYRQGELLELRGQQGLSVAHAAVRHPRVARWAVRSNDDLLHLENDDGVTVLQWAGSRYEPFAVALMSAPRDVRAVEMTTGDSAAHWAVKHHQAAAVEALKYPDVYSAYVTDGGTIAHVIVDRYSATAPRVLEDENLGLLVGRNGRTVEEVALKAHPDLMLGRIVEHLAADPDDRRARSCWQTAVRVLPDRALIVTREEAMGETLMAVGLAHPDGAVRQDWMRRLGRVRRR